MKTKLLAGAMALALVGCSEQSAEETSASVAPDTASSAAAEESADAAAAPRIASAGLFTPPLKRYAKVCGRL